MHVIALQFTGSATPPNVYLTSFYVGVLPVLPLHLLLGTRLEQTSRCYMQQNLYPSLIHFVPDLSGWDKLMPA